MTAAGVRVACGVDPRAAVHLVVPGLAADGVVAAGPEQMVVARAADDRVVPAEAGDRVRRTVAGQAVVVVGAVHVLDRVEQRVGAMPARRGLRGEVYRHRRRRGRVVGRVAVRPATQLVASGAAAERVVACLPDELVVLRTAVQRVRAVSPVEDVVLQAAAEQVGAAQAVERVSAVSARQRVRAGGAGELVRSLAAYDVLDVRTPRCRLRRPRRRWPRRPA